MGYHIFSDTLFQSQTKCKTLWIWLSKNLKVTVLKKPVNKYRWENCQNLTVCISKLAPVKQLKTINIFFFYNSLPFAYKNI